MTKTTAAELEAMLRMEQQHSAYLGRRVEAMREIVDEKYREADKLHSRIEELLRENASMRKMLHDEFHKVLKPPRQVPVGMKALSAEAKLRQIRTLAKQVIRDIDERG